MSYLGSRIAAPVSHPQGLTLWPDLTLFSSTESRPPWRGLNPCPTELKMMTLPMCHEIWLRKHCQLELFTFIYLCKFYLNTGSPLTLQASVCVLHLLQCAYSEQEVIANHYIINMFPTYPELNMSGPRDSLYIERSYCTLPLGAVSC